MYVVLCYRCIVYCSVVSQVQTLFPRDSISLYNPPFLYLNCTSLKSFNCLRTYPWLPALSLPALSGYLLCHPCSPNFRLNFIYLFVSFSGTAFISISPCLKLINVPSLLQVFPPWHLYLLVSPAVACSGQPCMLIEITLSVDSAR